MLSRNRSDEEKLACLFRLYDVDGDDLISPEDVAAFHNLTLGPHMEGTGPFAPMDVSTSFSPELFSKLICQEEAFLLLNLP